jgi:phage terminase small subunit
MASKPLTPKQAAFVREFLIDLNAAAAYRRAGYKPRSDHAASVNASALMAKHGIAEAIKAAQQARAQRTEIEADRVLKELGRIGFSDPRKLFGEGGSLKAIKDLDDDTAAGIASVEVFEEFAGVGAARHLVGYTRKLRLWDKNSALEKIGKHLGMFKEPTPPPDPGRDRPLKVELTIKVLRELPDDELPALYRETLAAPGPAQPATGAAAS